MTFHLDVPNKNTNDNNNNNNNNNLNNPWMEAESSLTQSALTFGDVNNNNNPHRHCHPPFEQQFAHNNHNNHNNNDNELQLPPLSWQRGRVRNNNNNDSSSRNTFTCFRGWCDACFWKIAIAWHVVVGGCALVYAVVWQRQLQQQQQQQSSSSQDDNNDPPDQTKEDIRWIEISITILLVVAGVEGFRALLLMVGQRSKRRSDSSTNTNTTNNHHHHHHEEDDNDDCHATFQHCVLWLASLGSAVSAMIHLVLAFMVLLGHGSMQAFLTNHHVSCDSTHGDHHATTLPALACPTLLSLLQNQHNLLWWIFLGNCVWECVQWQWIQLHRQALLQPLYVVLDTARDIHNSPPSPHHHHSRQTVNGRSSWWQQRNRTTPRIRPWWWKSRQEEEAAVAADASDMLQPTATTTLTESLLDEYNQNPHGVPSWVTSSSSTTQHQDPERLESSTIWRLFGIHRANQRSRDDDDDDDDDEDAAEFESVREEWASRSSEDPFWWSRDNETTNTMTSTHRDQ